ncbi:hypothetical protein GQ55_9G251900 [Panicum hallii var. hallii]|uniref:Uncharacterized protein n=1 Tax=Panicum hallii var. hallii TaxID=1504633 RepID=A0A2T7C6U5_9POAL|nr:hypothetical protein GQ55_9G251900 [Panicum hallii var. hallii]
MQWRFTAPVRSQPPYPGPHCSRWRGKRDRETTNERGGREQAAAQLIRGLGENATQEGSGGQRRRGGRRRGRREAVSLRRALYAGRAWCAQVRRPGLRLADGSVQPDDAAPPQAFAAAPTSSCCPSRVPPPPQQLSKPCVATRHCYRSCKGMPGPRDVEW